MARHHDHGEIDAAYARAPGKTRAARVRNAAAIVGCSVGTVRRVIKGRTAGASSHSPSGPTPIGERRANVLPVGHPATMEGRTLYPSTVLDVAVERVLKKGDNSAKIGSRIAKGAWAGFPIFTLTIEERATCPTSCKHWGSCYGNNMHYARRWRGGAELEWALRLEVASLERDNPAGFALRLHNLGDFYSVGYVRMWRELLEAHPALHVFGYTARHETMDDEIAYELAMLVRDYWVIPAEPRFCVRFSNAPVGVRSTVSIESPVQKPADAIICPSQWTPSGKKSESCATCALCWGTRRRIAFLQH